MGFDARYKILVSTAAMLLSCWLAAEQMLLQKWLSCCYIVQLFTTPNGLKMFPMTDYITSQS